MINTSQSEFAVIGSVLLDPSRNIDIVSGLCNPADFSNQHCRTLMEYALAEKMSFDAPRSVDILSTRMSPEEASEFVNNCIQIGTASDIEARAKDVARAGRLRRLMDGAYAALSSATDPDDLASELAGLARTGFGKGDHEITLAEAEARLYKSVETRNTNLMHLTTWNRLDKIMGGLKPGQLVIAASRPGGCKSVLCLSVAKQITKAYNCEALLYSAEMDADDVAERSLTQGSVVDMEEMSTIIPDLEFAQRLCDSVNYEWSVKQRVIIDDATNLTISRIRAGIARHPEVKLVIIDYLGLMCLPKAESRTVQLGNCTRELKNLAKEAGVVILLACQLNRESGDGSRPTVSQLRESGAIEQDADKVLLLHSPKSDRVAIDVGKNRRGKTGIVIFKTDLSHMTLIETDEEYTVPGNRRKNKGDDYFETSD